MCLEDTITLIFLKEPHVNGKVDHYYRMYACACLWVYVCHFYSEKREQVSLFDYYGFCSVTTTKSSLFWQHQTVAPPCVDWVVKA